MKVYPAAMQESVAGGELSSSPGHVTRRDLFAVIGSMVALLPASRAMAQATPAPIDRATFLDASSVVTGLPAQELTGLADALFTLFQSEPGSLLRLAELARNPPAGGLAAAIRGTPLDAFGRQLAVAWYSGVAGAGLVSYDDALAWKVTGFDVAPGSCAGEFGFWSEPPVAR